MSIDPNDETGPAVGIVAAPRKPWSQSIDRAPVLTPERAAELLADECEPEADEAPREHAYRDPSDASTWHLPPRQVTHEEARRAVEVLDGPQFRESLALLARYFDEREAAERELRAEVAELLPMLDAQALAGGVIVRERDAALRDRDHHRAAFDRLAAWVRHHGGDAALDEAMGGAE